MSLRGFRIYSTSYWSEGGFRGLSIRTVRTDEIIRFQSVYDLKITSYYVDLEYFSLFTGAKGVLQVGDPHGSYRWIRPFSI